MQAFTVGIRRIDGAYRVYAHIDGLEHTHNHPCPFHSEAEKLRDRILSHLNGGGDLNLAHYDTESLR